MDKITFTIKRQHHYDVTVEAMNSAGSATSHVQINQFSWHWIGIPFTTHCHLTCILDSIGYLIVYDIESDGTLSNGVGYPAVMNEFTSSNGNEQGPSFGPETENCQITTFPGVINAVCTFPSDTMATGFQIIAQLSDSDQVHRLHSNQSTGLQTPRVIVQVEESGMYKVAIFLTRNSQLFCEIHGADNGYVYSFTNYYFFK